MYNRGGKSTGLNAKNYIGREAQRRMDEVIRPMQEQGLNALNVDSILVELFQTVPSNLECTCRKVQILESSVQGNNASNPLMKTRSNTEIELKWNRPLFGTKNETPQVGDDFDEDDMSISDDDDTENTGALGTAAQLFGTSVDCGICMRTGMVPGYSSYGRQRVLLCSHHLEAMHGFLLMQNEAPNVLESQHPESYVEYALTIPKYFKGARIGLWDNKNLISTNAQEFMSINSTAVSMSLFRAHAGKTIPLRLSNIDRFTHLVIDFDLGLEPVRVNVAQMTRATDWTMLDTLGQLNFILPMTVPQVNNGDVIYLPTRKQVFKVSDVTHMQTALNEKLDWNAQSRVVQPHETLHNLRKGGKLI